MPGQDAAKVCFVIAPIGEEGSDIRRRSDQVFKHIVTPAAKECGYETIRADTISEPGMITSQVIQHLLDDALVVADLTGRNPNVFYELAVRHAVRKPVVQVIQAGEPIPFDVSQSRTIQVDHHDLDSAARCRDELIKQIHAVEHDPANVDTPISVAIDVQHLRESKNPLEKSSAEIMSMLQDMRGRSFDIMQMMSVLHDVRSRVEQLADAPTRARIPPFVVEDLLTSFGQLIAILDLPPWDTPSPSMFHEALNVVVRAEQPLRVLCVEYGMPPEMVERVFARSRNRMQAVQQQEFPRPRTKSPRPPSSE